MRIDSAALRSIGESNLQRYLELLRESVPLIFGGDVFRDVGELFDLERDVVRLFSATSYMASWYEILSSGFMPSDLLEWDQSEAGSQRGFEGDSQAEPPFDFPRLFDGTEYDPDSAQEADYLSRGVAARARARAREEGAVLQSAKGIPLSDAGGESSDGPQSRPARVPGTAPHSPDGASDLKAGVRSATEDPERPVQRLAGGLDAFARAWMPDSEPEWKRSPSLPRRAPNDTETGTRERAARDSDREAPRSADKPAPHDSFLPEDEHLGRTVAEDAIAENAAKEATDKLEAMKNASGAEVHGVMDALQDEGKMEESGAESLDGYARLSRKLLHSLGRRFETNRTVEADGGEKAYRPSGSGPTAPARPDGPARFESHRLLGGVTPGEDFSGAADGGARYFQPYGHSSETDPARPAAADLLPEVLRHILDTLIEEVNREYRRYYGSL